MPLAWQRCTQLWPWQAVTLTWTRVGCRYQPLALVSMGYFEVLENFFQLLLSVFRALLLSGQTLRPLQSTCRQIPKSPRARQYQVQGRCPTVAIWNWNTTLKECFLSNSLPVLAIASSLFVFRLPSFNSLYSLRFLAIANHSIQLCPIPSNSYPFCPIPFYYVQFLSIPCNCYPFRPILCHFFQFCPVPGNSLQSLFHPISSIPTYSFLFRPIPSSYYPFHPIPSNSFQFFPILLPWIWIGFVSFWLG